MSTVKELIASIQNSLDELKVRVESGGDIEDVLPAEKPTNEQVSLNVSGTPDLHVRNPEQFLKMSKFYDPERVPFTSSTWFTTSWGQKDARPYRDVIIDDVTYKRKVPSAAGASWYWIIRGVRDVSEKPWHMESGDFNQNGGTSKQNFDRIRAYQGTAPDDFASWPEDYKYAYLETHDEPPAAGSRPPGMAAEG